MKKNFFRWALTKFFRVSALVVLCSIFSIFSGFSQVIQGKGWSLSVRVPYNTAEEFKAENTKNFNNFLRTRTASINDGVKRIHLEHFVINKGESSRIGIIFNGRGSTKTVERIVIEGVGETTPEDIKNGFFAVTINPEKSTLYRISTYAKDSTGKVECYKENRRLVVVDVDKKEYDKIVRQVYIYERSPEALLRNYLNKLADGVPGDSIAEIPEPKRPAKSWLTTDEILADQTRRFERLSLNNNGKNRSYLRSTLEHEVIKRGDSTRIKYVFNNRILYSIEIEGVGQTTPKDIRNGEFIVTVKPDKTTLYRANITIRDPDGRLRETRGLDNRRVIVVEPKKFDKILLNVFKIRRTDRNGDKVRKYLNELADGVPER
jgi:hypothetical protein